MEEDNIRLFKLVTSEEVVAKVISEKEGHYVLEKPRLCAMQQGKGEDGKIGNFLVLLPWIMYATDPNTGTEKDIKLYKNVIAGEPIGLPLVMEKEYLSVTSTIQLIT